MNRLQLAHIHSTYYKTIDYDTFVSDKKNYIGKECLIIQEGTGCKDRILKLREKYIDEYNLNEDSLYIIAGDTDYGNNGSKKYMLIDSFEFRTLVSKDNNLYDLFLNGQSELFFDIDIKLENHTKQEFNEFKKDITMNTFEEFNALITQYLKLEDNTMIVLKSNNDDEKISYHIHFVNIYVQSEFSKLKLIFDHFDCEANNNILLRYIDYDVYKNSQALRTINQTKKGSNRELQFYFEFTNKYETIMTEPTDLFQRIQIEKFRNDEFILQPLDILNHNKIEFKNNINNTALTNIYNDECISNYDDQEQHMVTAEHILMTKKITETIMINVQLNNEIYKNLFNFFAHKYKTHIEVFNNIEYLQFEELAGTKNNKYICVCGDVHLSNRNVVKYDISENTLFGFCFLKRKCQLIKTDVIKSESQEIEDMEEFCIKHDYSFKKVKLNKDEYLSDKITINDMDVKMYTFIRGICSIGKSKLIFEYIELDKFNKIIIVCSLISMVNQFETDLRKLFGDNNKMIKRYDNYDDVIAFNSNDDKEIMITTINSLYKIKSDHDLLIFDESTSEEKTLLQYSSKKVDLNAIMWEYIANRQCVFLDATVDNLSIEFYEKLSNYEMTDIQIFYVIKDMEEEIIIYTQVPKKEPENQTHKYTAGYQHTKIEQMQMLLTNIYDQSNETMPCMTISTDQRESIEQIEDLLVQVCKFKSSDILIIHGEQDKDFKMELFKNINETIKKYKVVIFSPTLVMAVSLLDERFTIHISLYHDSNLCDPEVILEETFRNRKSKKIYILSNNKKEPINRIIEGTCNNSFRYALYDIVKEEKYSIYDLLKTDCKNIEVTDDINCGFQESESSSQTIELQTIEHTHINFACEDIIDELKDVKNQCMIENKLYLQKKYIEYLRSLKSVTNKRHQLYLENSAIVDEEHTFESLHLQSKDDTRDDIKLFMESMFKSFNSKYTGNKFTQYLLQQDDKHEKSMIEEYKNSLNTKHNDQHHNQEYNQCIHDYLKNEDVFNIVDRIISGEKINITDKVLAKKVVTECEIRNIQIKETRVEKDGIRKRFIQMLQN